MLKSTLFLASRQTTKIHAIEEFHDWSYPGALTQAWFIVIMSSTTRGFSFVNDPGLRI
jgi:hypothetical protein